MEVTFIMPVYNAVAFLEDSINSLFNQSNKNWRLICVDDGSTDNSKELLEVFASRDSRITVLSKSNGGAGAARAFAIQYVKTEYLAILDADDTVSPDYVETFIDNCEDTLDIYIPNVKCVDEKNNVELLNHFDRNDLRAGMKIMNKQLAFEWGIEWKLVSWNILKTEFAKRNYLLQYVDYSRYNSDEYISRYLCYKANGIKLLPCIYYYKSVPTSTTRKLSPLFFDRLLTYEKLLLFCIEEKMDDRIIYKVYETYRGFINGALLLNYKEFSGEYVDVIKSSYRRCVRKSFKIAFWKHAGFKSIFKDIFVLSSFNAIRLLAYLKFVCNRNMCIIKSKNE